MHYATKAGHSNVVKLFVKSSADPQAETKDGKVRVSKFLFKKRCHAYNISFKHNEKCWYHIGVSVYRSLYASLRQITTLSAFDFC